MRVENLILGYEYYLVFLCVFTTIFSFFIPQEFIVLFIFFFVTGWLGVIIDLLLSSAKKDQKITWLILLVLFNGMILPFYWYLYLRNRKHSYLLERLSTSQ